MNVFSVERGNSTINSETPQEERLATPKKSVTKQGFGERIKQARLQLGVTRGDFVSPEALGKELDVAGQTIRNWESEFNEPDLDTFLRLAKVLKTNRIWLTWGVQMGED